MRPSGGMIENPTTVTPPSSVIAADRGLVSVEAHSFEPSEPWRNDRKGGGSRFPSENALARKYPKKVPEASLFFGSPPFSFRPEPLWRFCGRYPLADKPGLAL